MRPFGFLLKLAAASPAVLRFLATLFLLVAAVALVSDATAPLAGLGPFHGTTFLEHWQMLSATTLKQADTFVSSKLAHVVWNPVMTTALSVPTYILFGALGVLAGYLGRRRHEINVYAN